MLDSCFLINLEGFDFVDFQTLSRVAIGERRKIDCSIKIIHSNEYSWASCIKTFSRLIISTTEEFNVSNRNWLGFIFMTQWTASRSSYFPKLTTRLIWNKDRREKSIVLRHLNWRVSRYIELRYECSLKHHSDETSVRDALECNEWMVKVLTQPRENLEFPNRMNLWWNVEDKVNYIENFFSSFFLGNF